MLGAASFGTQPVGTIPVEPAERTAGVPERVWILTGQLSDAATISTVGAAQMPAANLQDRDPTKKWRGTGRTESLLFTFPGPTICNALFLGGHNHTPGGCFRVLAGDAAAGGVITSVALDTNWASVWPLGVKPQITTWSSWGSILRWTNSTPYTYYQLDLGDDGVGLADLQAGRVMLGYAWQPAVNVDFGARIGITNNDFRQRSPWNRISTGRRLPGRTIRLPFSASDEADAIDQAMELQRSLGTALDLVVALDPAGTSRFHRTTLHGTLMDTGDFEALALWSANGPQWKFELAIEEL